MINRDKFDTLESVIQDRGIFSHIATLALTFAITLGVEKFVEHQETPSDTTYYLLWLCSIVGVFGLIFALLTLWKFRRYRTTRAGLFKEENLVSDQMFVHTMDGTTVKSEQLIR